MRATILLLFVNGVSAIGSSPETTPRRLTLADALATAERNNPRLRVSAAGVEVADAAAVTARARPNPSITAGALGYQRGLIDGSVPGMLNGFAVNQPIEMSRLRGARVQMAEVGRESSRHALDETRLAVRGSVKQAFYETLRRNAEGDLARGNLQLLENLRRRIEVQVRVGEAARLELTRADAEVSAARIQVESAEIRKSVALSALYAAMGEPLGDVEPDGALDPPRGLPPLDALVEEILRAHPAVALADSEVRRAAALVDYERAQRTPQPTFWADVFRQPDVSQYRYGVTIDIPVWNRRQGPIAEAVAATRQASATADQRRLELSAAVQRVYKLYEIANRQVEMFEAGTLRSAEAAVQAAETAFRFGERSIIEVLDAQRVLRAARQEYLSAQYDRQAALIEIEQLRGIGIGGNTP